MTSEAETGTDPRLAVTVTHRRYVPYSHAHYAGNLVDGAYVLAMFGDVATELLIRLDGDEGLFRAYDSIEFLAPLYAGDYVEVEGEITTVGRTSRKMRFTGTTVLRLQDGKIAEEIGLDDGVTALRQLGLIREVV